ncbi:MAG: adenosine kinase [Rikenellaceae bacterium]|nr:adenosine kinase [Rikenellaceae bacterium]
MKKVIGIGNALTDILVNLQRDDILESFHLAKGSMSLVDADLQRQISDATADLPHTLSLGGSAGNTIRAMAKLGCRTGYIGKVGRDTTGDFLLRALENLGVEPKIYRGDNPSGVCISLVSPDGERTMATYLGAALEMCPGEISKGIFDGYDCLYIEGYLVQDHALIGRAVEYARQCGLKVAIDLASFNVVEENLGFLRGLVENYVDIIFANEQEASAFTGEEDPMKALDIIAAACELAVVKIGIKGACIKQNGETTHVGIMTAANRVDTTGAGDFYAAGFLYGLCRGLTLRQCGTIGAITAGKVIEVIGTTFAEEVWDEIHKLVTRVETQQYLF